MGILMAFVVLLAGSGVFIAGMNMMGDGMEKSAGSGLKKLLGKISNNRFAGVGIGAGVTGIIQSSAATTVMAIGFVNAGIMTLTQATAIIMGANIGTTVTGVIVSLKSLGISTYASLLAFVGVMMTFVKSEKVKQIGSILCGFGLIFVGLDIMGSAFDNYQELTDFFKGLFEKISFPLLLIVCGMIFTALIQSSSAATGIFITMVGAGSLSLDSALFLVLGSNIGTCITAILAAMGANVNSKRTAFIHLTFNVSGTFFFTVFIWIFKDFAVSLLQNMLPGNPQMQLAWFHVIFNVTTTLILLPFIKQLVQLATLAIKDKPSKEDMRHLKYVDERLLKTPAIAVMQVKKEIEYMTSVARANIEKSFEAMNGNAENYAEEIRENEKIVDFTNQALTKYLIKLSSLVDGKDEQKIGSYFHVLNDVERIGDHAENFFEIGLQMQQKGLEFSEIALKGLLEMQAKVLRMFEVATEAFDDTEIGRLKELTVLENEVDGMKRDLSAGHFARLAEGSCCVELSPYFSSTIAGLERVGDHLVNVGYSILNPTGSQSLAKKILEENE
ncbi:MAG: Na/Pi cotransporter family protein [Clostridia bacterium]|nr:Na/Pi cotransporter family protein [Clostridia bacterium]